MAYALTPKLLGGLARAALDNSSNLLADAKLLLNEGRHPRALALTVLAAEEFGKHMICMSAAAFDLEDPTEVKKFWKRFRSHEAKYQNWHGQLIDYIAIDPRTPFEPSKVEPDLWDEMWQEMPHVVEEAMTLKLRALYVDEQDGQPTRPDDLVDPELAITAWKDVSMIVEDAQTRWARTDLSEFLERSAPRINKLRLAMLKAKETGDPNPALSVFGDILGLSEEEMARLGVAWTAPQSPEEE
jgi:AbiV family abortive infection protein